MIYLFYYQHRTILLIWYLNRCENFIPNSPLDLFVWEVDQKGTLANKEKTSLITGFGPLQSLAHPGIWNYLETDFLTLPIRVKLTIYRGEKVQPARKWFLFSYNLHFQECSWNFRALGFMESAGKTVGDICDSLYFLLWVLIYINSNAQILSTQFSKFWQLYKFTKLLNKMKYRTLPSPQKWYLLSLCSQFPSPIHTHLRNNYCLDFCNYRSLLLVLRFHGHKIRHCVLLYVCLSLN